MKKRHIDTYTKEQLAIADQLCADVSKSSSDELLSGPLAGGDNEESAGSIRAPLSSPFCELLPCPFCGGSDFRVENNYYPMDEGEAWGVECKGCGGENRLENWNSRASGSERAG